MNNATAVADLADIRLSLPPKRIARGGEWDWFTELSFGDQQACRRHMVRGGMDPAELAGYMGTDTDDACSRWRRSFRQIVDEEWSDDVMPENEQQEQMLGDYASEAREWTRRRDAQIREMVADGRWSLRDLAALTGLSHTAIAKISRRGG